MRYIHNSSKIPFCKIIEIVKFLFDNQFFEFGGDIFKQIKAMFMGSPTSPLFADIEIENCETECLSI